MKGVMRLLAAAKLVTLSDEDRAHEQPDPTAEIPAEQDLAADIMPLQVPLAEGDIVEDRPFADIFASAQLPPSPFPAERLLRLLDGLRAMDEATRKAAVLAMDAADENWTIADPMMDAQRKIAVLESYREALDTQLASNEQKMSADIASLRVAQESTAAEIRKQIAELEKLLEREVQKTAEQIAALEAGLKAARESTAREGRRMTAEIDRLREIPAQFAHPAPHQ